MLRLPAHVQLEITDVCNLRCGHCYRFNTDAIPTSHDLNDDQIIELVESLIQSKIYSLTITGGEPLSRFGATSKAVQMAKQAGVYVSINSNLLLLRENMLDQLCADGLDGFLVSCPASDANVYKQITRCGNFHKFRDKLKLLLSSNISVLVNMVVSQSNRHLVRSTAKDLSELGVKRFSATPASLNVEFPDFDSLLTAEQTIALLEDLRWCSEELGLKVDMLVPLPKCFLPAWCWEKEYGFTRRACQAGRMSAIVSNLGEVRPCPHNPISYGNLLREPLEEIWDNMAVYRSAQDGVVPVICYHCPALLSCNGSCRTNSLAITGRLNQPERFTTGPISLPARRRDEIALSQEMTLKFNGYLKWRQEVLGNYSIASTKGCGNLLVINEEFFRFVVWLEKSLPLKICELIPKIPEDSNQQVALFAILQTLIRRDFLRVVDN